jgi:hypothetical protein
MGASKPPLSIVWDVGLVPNGASDATAPRTVTLANPYPATLKVALYARSIGFDERDVRRKLLDTTVLGNDKAIETVLPSTFPIQSVNTRSSMVLEAVITDGPANLLGVKIASKRVFYSYNSNFAQVSFFGTDASSGNGLNEATNKAQVLAALQTLGTTLKTRTGRIWNGTALVDIATLAKTSDFPASYVVDGTYTFSDGVAAKWTTLVDPNLTFPGNGNWQGGRVCANTRQDFIDDGRGEAISATEMKASYWKAKLVDIDSQVLLFDGFLDVNGCTPSLPGFRAYTSYALTVQSALRDSARSVNVDSVKTFGTPIGNDFPSSFGMYFGTLGTPLGALRVRLRGGDERANAAAVVSRILSLGNATVPVPAANYRINIARCGNDPTSFTACFEPGNNTLWLGQNNDPGKTQNASWKYVVAHEFGHAIQAAFGVAPQVNYGAPTTSICGCDQVFDPVDRSHCMTSKEFNGGVGNESFGHLIAANTWNTPGSATCKFVYYKETIDTGVTLTPPVAIDCNVQAKWLETKCLEADRGVEWDWMNWKRAVGVAPVAQQTNVTELADIYKRACGGVSCANLNPSAAQLIAAARTKYGVGTPKASLFEAQVALYGANH